MSAPTLQDAGPALAAEELRALAAHHAAGADHTRKLAPEVVDTLRRTGFARHFVASERGGAQGSFAELTRAVITIGEGCAATAWCASLAAGSARFAAHLPEEGQQEIWGGGPDALVATALVPAGRAEPVDGGWRLAGQWRYVSGAGFSDWVLVCAPVTGAGGPPDIRFFALPGGRFTVLDTWDSIGMRATGSHTLVVEDQFVPRRLSFDRMEMILGRNTASAAEVHNVPLRAVSGLTFVAPVIGAALGALNSCAALTTGRRRTPANEITLVRASGLIDAARHLAEQSARAADDRLFAPELLARGERNAAVAAGLCAEAVHLLVRGAGTAGLSESQPLQRFWRDVVSAASHTALQYETSAGKNYAATLLGPPDPA